MKLILSAYLPPKANAAATRRFATTVNPSLKTAFLRVQRQRQQREMAASLRSSRVRDSGDAKRLEWHFCAWAELTRQRRRAALAKAQKLWARTNRYEREHEGRRERMLRCVFTAWRDEQRRGAQRRARRRERLLALQENGASVGTLSTWDSLSTLGGTPSRRGPLGQGVSS